MRTRTIYSLILVCVTACACSQGDGQIDPRLQAVDSHFAGVWVGTNYDYTKPTMVTTPVRLEIKDDPKKGILRIDYTYGIKGQKSYEHLVRFMAINPSKGTVTLNWQYEAKEAYDTAGLDKLLNAGYGDLEISDADYHAIFRLAPDRFSYFWEKSDENGEYSKTGEWTMTRASGASGTNAENP